jgi:hypothetical protein
MMKISLLIALVLICAIAGCKIDESGLPQIQSNSSLYGTWLVKAVTTITPAQPPYPETIYTETDFTANDFFMFNNDNTVKISLSNPSEVVTSRYSYVSNASGQVITMPDPKDGTNDTYVIQKLTKDSLVMSTTITATSSPTNTVIYPVIYKLAHN